MPHWGYPGADAESKYIRDNEMIDLIRGAMLVLGLLAAGALQALPIQTENFDSAESAAANGWTVLNGCLQCLVHIQ